MIEIEKFKKIRVISRKKIEIILKILKIRD